MSDVHNPGNADPGNADVPVGDMRKRADEDVGDPRADGDVGDPGADGDVGDPRADGDVGDPRADGDVGGPRADGDVGGPRKPSQRAREWYSRGYLPHRDAPRLIQSVTYRLADSLPQEKLRLLSDELACLADDQIEIERRKRIEEWLDAGMGCCALGHPEVARFVQNAFLRFHGERYNLHAWCVMPNHVHVLVEPRTDISVVIQGWKSFTARWILRQNQRLGLQIPESNRLWMREYWDRFIRDAEHYQKVVAYIHRNPVKAGLCREPEDWPWSSGNADPGNADVPVGDIRKRADGDVGDPRADGDVGDPRADGDVGDPRADGDVGGPRNGAPRVFSHLPETFA